MEEDKNYPMFSNTVLNRTNLSSEDPMYGQVIILQEMPIDFQETYEVTEVQLNQLNFNHINQVTECQSLLPRTENNDETTRAVQILTDSYQLVSKEVGNKLYHEDANNILPHADNYKAKLSQNIKPTVSVVRKTMEITNPENVNMNPSQSVTANTKIISAKTFIPEMGKEFKPMIQSKMKCNKPVLKTENNIEDVTDSSKRRKQKTNNFLCIPDRVVAARALAVLPAVLRSRRDVIAPHPRALPPRVRFGPVQGIPYEMSHADVKSLVTKCVSHNRPVFLQTNQDESITFIDTSDQDKANWFSLLPLGDMATANVWLQEVDGQLYAFTTDVIQVRTPLKLGYSKEYAAKYGIQDGQPILDLNAELQKVTSEWWCTECSKAFPSLIQLQIHVDKLHSADPPKGRYRCRYCTRRFARLFCLKRHIAKFCTQAKKKNNLKITENQQEPSANQKPTLSDDSNRLPSDESLQNYTNILDISTSLFDPDRISNLDISGYKSETDFNALKDDIRLTADFDFTHALLADFEETVPNENEVAAKKNFRNQRSSSPISCPYCKTNMCRSKLKQHARVCLARQFECVCGLKFRRKEKLAEHMCNTHPIPSAEAETTVIETEKEHGEVSNEKSTIAAKPMLGEPYVCAQCGISFKRRGMYINHTRALHGELPPPPLYVRDRRYPCPAAPCARVYRARGKRDRHCQRHHPGVVYDRMSSVIVGVTREMTPAQCPRCPRQYATRAKLLQHIRKNHPAHVDQVEKPKKKSPKKYKKKEKN